MPTMLLRNMFTPVGDFAWTTVIATNMQEPLTTGAGGLDPGAAATGSGQVGPERWASQASVLAIADRLNRGVVGGIRR